MRSKKALYNVLTNLILQIVIIIYGFIVPKIIISKFGSSVNGLVSSITQFLAYITLLESGFGPIIKASLYKPIAKKNKKEIENILLASEKIFKRIATIFIVYILGFSIIYSFVVSKEFNYLYTISLIIIISISTFSEYFFGMTYRIYLKANQETYVISIIQIISYILSIILIVVSAMLGASIQVIKLISGLVFALRPIVQNVYVKRKYNINLSNAEKDYKIKNKWDGLAQHIAAVIHENTDITVLTLFCKLSEVSVYAVYYLVIRGIKSILQSFSSGIESLFGDMIAKSEFENLNKKFNVYEVLYFTVVTILCACAGIMITPFVKVYTRGITDADYIRYTFGYLMITSELFNSIRDPYISLSYAAGHFKETRKGAWVEAITNILISVLLVIKLGIVGVAIGTLVAMTIRTSEFIYHSSKYILKRSIWKSIKKIVIIIVEILIILCVTNCVPFMENISYSNWIINSLIVVIISIFTVLSINFIFYKKEYVEILSILKGLLNRRRKKK